MHFITEDVLRQKYRQKAFQRYTCPPNHRLTPAAREFLNDFRISLVEEEGEKKPEGLDKESPPGKEKKTVFFSDWQALKEQVQIDLLDFYYQLEVGQEDLKGATNYFLHRLEEVDLSRKGGETEKIPKLEISFLLQFKERAWPFCRILILLDYRLMKWEEERKLPPSLQELRLSIRQTLRHFQKKGGQD